MKKKRYIREGGLCQFWDNWSNGAHIQWGKINEAIKNAQEKNENTTTDSTAKAMAFSPSNNAPKEKEINKPFNKTYKTYEKKN